MPRQKSLFLLVFLASILLSGMFSSIAGPQTTKELPQETSKNSAHTVQLEDGSTIDVGPDETLTTYTLSSVSTSTSGVASNLNVTEYGSRSDTFSDNSMKFQAALNQTTNTTVSIPVGDLWQGEDMYVGVSNLEENRTWLQNYDFAGSSAGWTLTTQNVGTYSNTLTSTYQNGYARFTLAGVPSGGYYRYDAGDRCYAQQSLTIDRGAVTWVGVSLDYYVDDAWSGLPIGFWQLYVQVGSADNPANQLWNKLFSDVASQSAWYSTGLVEGNASLVTLPSLTLQAGVRTYRSFGANPDLLPEVRMDNIKVYIKTQATPSQVNLKVNGQAVGDYMIGGVAQWALGNTSMEGLWTGNYANATFSWYPDTYPLDPNLDVIVTFSVDTTLWAKKPDRPTLYRGEVKSYGESYSVSNASDVQWTSYYYVSVPPGYSNYFYFNVTEPSSRAITFVSSPAHPSVDFGYWNTGSDYLNVSVYKNTTASTQAGFWTMKGTSANLITDLTMYAGVSWDRTGTFRANDNLQFRATTPQLADGAIVTFSVFNTSDAMVLQESATVASGVATTTGIDLDPSLFETGQWAVQAFVNNSISGSPVHDIGFYSRVFSIKHSTNMYIMYPQASKLTWTDNATLGDEFLFQVRVNDSDNGDLLPGGLASYNWTTGVEPLSDQSTGEYNTLLNTLDLGHRGRFLVEVTWSKEYYDTIVKQFILNVVEETDLTTSTQESIAPRGWNATFQVTFKDSIAAGISGASILCNWTDSPYYVAPVLGSPGSYLLTITTYNSDLGTYPLTVEARADYYVTSRITVYVKVRQLLTSATLSSSSLVLPSGYMTRVNLTYWDTDHNLPMLGAENLISCNWSESHLYGELNYSTTMVSPGVYEITLYGTDADLIRQYDVVLQVNRFATKNHTLSVPLTVTTRETSFYPDYAVDPTPYSGYVTISVTYYDITADMGIANNTANGHSVYIYATAAGIVPLLQAVQNGSAIGQYIILIPANQWADISGWKTVTLFANWTGDVAKYQNMTLTVNFRLTQSPTDLFIGQDPVSTPYGDNITFSVFYWDIAGSQGIANATGPYPGNVQIHIVVLTPGETLTQDDMVVTELGGGEYQIQFNTSLLSGLVSCELRIFANWTKGVLPLYENSTFSVVVSSTYRQTQVQWSSLPTTPYDGPLNLTFSFIDVLTSSRIANNSALTVSIQELGVMSGIYYNSATKQFTIMIDTTYWNGVGTFNFHLDVTWSGAPFYQNRTDIEIPVTIRYRTTDLSHSSITKVQYGENVTIVFTYTDTDDGSTAGMAGSDLSLDAVYSGYYTVYDDLNGNYSVVLNSTAFGKLGVFLIHAYIVYGGSRFCLDATDFFYLTVVQRTAFLTGDQIDPVPFLSLANLSVQYTDEITLLGISGASLQVSSDDYVDPLAEGVNYWVVDLGTGEYIIRINTTALGSFKVYTITISTTWIGVPYHANRSIAIPVEVTRRDASIRVTTSPLSTPFLELASFEITLEDLLSGQPISITKSDLILSHGAGIPLLGSDYVLSGSNGVYWITVNSTIFSSVPVANYPINIDFYWGDIAPFYSNSTTSTKVTITNRYTQASILSTPAAYYNYNTSLVVSFTDYLKGSPITGAIVTFICFNETSVQGVAIDNGDGTYTISTNTSQLPTLGRYLFTVNFTWPFSQPFYKSILGRQLAVTVSPVATLLRFILPEGETYYPGDIIVGNISFTALLTGDGIDGVVSSNWNETYPTPAYIVKIGKGLWSISISTTNFNADLFSFQINATKHYFSNKTITADIVLSPLPIEVEMTANPTTPVWGMLVQLNANVTDARTGAAILGANTQISILGVNHTMTEIGGGIYQYSLDTSSYNAGLLVVSITVKMVNHETRQRDFQIRVSKVDSTLSATADPLVIFNGASVNVQANYSVVSSGTEISSGTLTFSWIGGTGSLTWSPSLLLYVGTVPVSGVPVGHYQILVQASSLNYKSLSLPLSIEVRVINTELVAEGSQTVLNVISGDFLNVTVYLNATDTNQPIDSASLSFGIGNLVDSLTELGGGYYRASINTTTLDILEYQLTITSEKSGYAPTSIQYTIEVQSIPTEILAVSDAIQSAYYGTHCTYRFYLNDTHNNVGVDNATSAFILGATNGSLVDLGNGYYELNVNTSALLASSIPYDISVSFQKDKYDYALTSAKIQVLPIPTEIVGKQLVSIPVGDDFKQLLFFNDTLNDLAIPAATATVIWTFGTNQLSDLGNGSYSFGFAEADISRLEIGNYTLRIIMSFKNYQTSELIVQLNIREIKTSVTYSIHPTPIYAGTVFYVDVTYYDDDHNVTIPLAQNTVTASGLSRLPDQDVDYGNGTYGFAFIAPNLGVYDIAINLSVKDYQAATASLTVYPALSQQQLALLTTFQYGAIILLLLTAVGAFYVRVLSVPKLLRKLRSMVSQLGKGKIPSPANVLSRREMLLQTMNEDLEPVGVRKQIEDVSLSAVEVEALDLEALLAELASLVGLTEADLDVLRADLEKMKPSERGGFITEVIRQERLRRAQDLATAAKKERIEEETTPPSLAPEDLEDLKNRLLAMGIEESEADLMVEQAKNLTKAEIDALLDQLGGREE